MEALQAKRRIITRLGFGTAAFLFGTTKFIWPDFWSDYTAAWFFSLVPLSGTVFMYIVGVIETVVGLSLLSGVMSRSFSGVASLWLLLVTINLLTAGYYDIALRDLGLSLLAFTIWVDHVEEARLSSGNLRKGAAI